MCIYLFIYAYMQVCMFIPEKHFAKILCELNKGWWIEYIYKAEKEIMTIEILDSFAIIIIINHYLKIVERFNKIIF